MKRRRAGSDGMDMLLDTMCCTFGGVCFISLMVTLMSSVVPSGAGPDAEAAMAAIARIAEREMDGRERRRDELKAAVVHQEKFIADNADAVVTRDDLAKMVSDAEADEGKLRMYEKKRIEYEDELAKLTTKTEYSRREAARLERLLAELREKAGKPLFDRHRAVRTPQERELSGLTMIDVWLHRRRLYMVKDRSQVSVNETGSPGSLKWDYTIIKGRGEMVDEDGFFSRGGGWDGLVRRLDAGTCVRIFTDAASFNELCVLRDALLGRNAKYNWIVCEGDTLHLVEGYDGKVQ